MKIEVNKNIQLSLLVTGLLTLSACNFSKDHASFADSTGLSAGLGSQGITPTGGTPVVGIGSSLLGTGATSVPTAKAAVGRIENAMGLAPTSRNLAAAYSQVASNLANSTDPTQFSGGDSNMILAYASCVDKYPASNWGLNYSKPPSDPTNQTALIQAGMTIMDKYTAGLASGGSNSVQVKAAITNIVNNSISDGVGTQTALITVCTAANTAGSTLLGF